MVKYTLSYESIDKFVEDLRVYLTDNRVAKKEVLRTTLLVEEVMLKYRDAFGEDAIVETETLSRIWKTGISIHVFGDALNPFSDSEDGMLKSLTASTISVNPVWKYEKASSAGAKGCNEIVILVPKQARVSNPVRFLITVIFFILFALLTKMLLSEEKCAIWANDFVLPVANTYTNFLSVMAILMIFFAIPLCIVQYGSIGTFRKTAKQVLKRFILIPLWILIPLGIVASMFVTKGGEAGDGMTIAKSILDIFIGMIPGNIVSPFLNFNCMQVMLIGLTFGLCFLVMGNESKTLVSIFDRCNFVAVLTNSYLARFVHFYVGVMAYYLVLTDYSVLFSEMLPIILIVVGACILSVVVFLVLTGIRLKVKPLILAKKFLPSFMVNLSSASVGASFMVFFDELVKDCGVELAYSGMAVNLGTVLFKPLYSVFLAVCGVGAAYLTDCLTFATLVQILLMAYILPVSIPNIQGGATSVIILMFSQIGIGNGMAELIVTINTLMQFLIVPANILCTQCLILLAANREHKVDLEKLRAPLAKVK